MQIAWRGRETVLPLFTEQKLLVSAVFVERMPAVGGCGKAPLRQPWEWLGEGSLGCLVPGRKPNARAVISTGQEGLLGAERGQDF